MFSFARTLGCDCAACNPCLRQCANPDSIPGDHRELAWLYGFWHNVTVGGTTVGAPDVVVDLRATCHTRATASTSGKTGRAIPVELIGTDDGPYNSSRGGRKLGLRVRVAALEAAVR